MNAVVICVLPHIILFTGKPNSCCGQTRPQKCERPNEKNILASIFVLTLAISNGVLAKGGGSGGSGGNAGAPAGTGTGVPVKDGTGVGAPAGAGTGSGVPVKDGTGIGAPVGAGTGTVVPRSVQGR